MATTLVATQISDTAARLVWVTDAVPAGSWIVSRDVDAAGYVDVGSVLVPQLTFDSDFDNPAAGAVVTYRLWAAGQPFTLADSLVWIEGVGTVNPLETPARYTDTATVKDRLRIPAANSGFDDRILASILAAEYGIDAELGVSFPNVDVSGIPATIIQAATSISMQVYKSQDAPTGTAGGDSLYGELDVSELVRREIQSNPLLKGLRSSWGVS